MFRNLWKVINQKPLQIQISHESLLPSSQLPSIINLTPLHLHPINPILIIITCPSSPIDSQLPLTPSPHSSVLSSAFPKLLQLKRRYQERTAKRRCNSDGRAYISTQIKRQGHNIIMSKIQAYKYSFIRRSNINHTILTTSEDNPKILRQKVDYTNLPLMTTTVTNRNDKTPTEETRLVSERRQELLLGEGRVEGLKEKRIADAKNNQYLAELIDLLELVARHTPTVEEYLRSERKPAENTNRDLEKEYRVAKEKLEQQRHRRPQFSLLRSSVINPEGDRVRTLAIKRNFQLKILPKKEEHLAFTHSVHTHRTETSKDKHRPHKMSLNLPRNDTLLTPLQIVNDKYRHCQEKARRLEETLNRETVLRAQGEALIAQLNQRVVESQMQVLNAKLKARTGSLFAS